MNIRTFADLETEIDHLRGELWEKKQLITELCDALEGRLWARGRNIDVDEALIQRARKAIK